MNATISKWGNSLGIRVPVLITESLGLKAGDKVDFEIKKDGVFIKKKRSTSQIFEEFYGKPFSNITQDDIGLCEELDWGDDVGGEII